MAAGSAVVLAYVLLTTSGGQPLHWNPATAPFSVNQKCSPDGPTTACVAAVEASFQAWNDVSAFHYHTDCLTTKDVASINPSHVQGSEQTDGDSIVTWFNSSWPYGSGTIAITFNWFDPNSGVIAEADMMANGQDYTWTTGDTGVQTDIQNFLTHEAGHYLGLGHSNDPTATMYPTGTQGETSKRTLAQDDIDGVQFLYGSGNTGAVGTAVACKTTNESPSCGCSTTEGRPRAAALAGLMAAALLGGFALLRRRVRARAGASLAGTVLAGAIAFAIGGTARATSMRTLSLGELAATSHTVVVGTISDVRAVTDGKTIHTVNTIVVHEVLAGRDFGTTLRVITPGGELPEGVAGPNGHRGLYASGVPRFVRGEEVALFAEHPDGAPADVLVVGSLAQGAFEVVRGNDGSVRLSRDLGDVLRVDRAPDGRLEPAMLPDPLAGLTLDALRSTLRAR